MRIPTKSVSTKQQNKRPLKKTFAYILLFLVALGAVAFFVVKSSYEAAVSTPNSTESTKVSFIIESGESLSSIAKNLVTQKLLKPEYQTYFEIYVRLNDVYSKFQAGNFSLPKNLTIVELAGSLQKAGIPEVWVTIPEGLRKDEIADIVAKELNAQQDTAFSKAEFLSLTQDKAFIDSLELSVKDLGNLEGFLFPDRYLFETAADAKQVLTKLVTTFKSKTGNNLTYQQLIKASLLEREGKNDTDRKMISDIIDRRINEGWFLNIDAALLYELKNWKAIPDTSVASPYNTYKNLGYPPTPICNPGLSSINATKSPTPNKYYYYIHDNSNQPHYAVTYNEHILNTQTYLNK